MVTLAYVNIWGQRAGVVMWNENTESAVFEYEPAFERLGLDLSPILMPLSPHRPYQFTSISKMPRGQVSDTSHRTGVPLYG